MNGIACRRSHDPFFLFLSLLYFLLIISAWRTSHFHPTRCPANCDATEAASSCKMIYCIPLSFSLPSSLTRSQSQSLDQMLILVFRFELCSLDAPLSRETRLKQVRQHQRIGNLGAEGCTVVPVCLYLLLIHTQLSMHNTRTPANV